MNAFIFQVFEDGKDSGEITVYISKKDLGTNCLTHPGDMMERVSILDIYLSSLMLFIVNFKSYFFKVFREYQSCIDL